MSVVWLGTPGLACAGLAILLWRRLISPTRFAQGITAITLCAVVLWTALGIRGGDHG